jgi:hypothetical protein
MHFSTNCSKEGTHVATPKENALVLISNALGKGARSCSRLLPSTRMGKNPKLGKYDKGN